MTPEQIKSDTEKFFKYLEANGAIPIASMFMVESEGVCVSLSYGANEMVSELSVKTLAHLQGFNLVERK